MHIVTYSELRNNLTQTMDEVLQDHMPVIITRGSKPPVVMISLEDFNAHEETSYLLRSPANRKRLLEAQKDIAQKKYRKHQLIKV